MKAKRSNFAGVIALLLVGAAGVYAIGLYIGRTSEAQNVPSAIHRTSRTDENAPASQSNKTDNSSVKVLTPKSQNGNLTMEQTTENVPDGADPIVFAINRYLENSHITPPEAKILKVEVKDGDALIDCTEAMDKTYGSSDEEALIQGLTKTLAQFPEIKNAKFYVSGKQIESWGNVDLTPGLDIKEPDDSSKPSGA
ncbi:MAG TPA: GerMN domain-containing protein [Fimbriimonadaceae bacterium]|nr:GerMN domain-containing protein [Fimbriimonadaceae bacterium]